MFKKNESNSSQKVETVIGKKTFFQGELKTEGSIRVEGEVKGRIEVKGNVFVGREGRVEADIHSHSIVVAGSVQADVICKGKLEILPQGKIVGDIETNQLIIQDGGTFIGQSKKYEGSRGEKVEDITTKLNKNEEEKNTEEAKKDKSSGKKRSS